MDYSNKEAIKEKLEEAIIKNLDDANGMDVGQDREATYKTTIDLIKTRESMDESEKAEAEKEVKVEAEKKESKWKRVINVCEIVVPVGAYFVVSIMGLNQERTGFIGGKIALNAIKSVRPKK